MRVIVIVRLKPGVTAATYEAWARESDLPSVRALPSIGNFDIFRTAGLLGGGQAPCDYVEMIDIADPVGFADDVASVQMVAVAAEFARLADATFIVVEPLG